MAYSITGTVETPLRPRKARTLEQAASKADDMKLSGIRDVRILDDRGIQLPAVEVEAATRHWRRRRKIQSLRRWAWSLFITPTIMLFPLALAPFFDPIVLLDSFYISFFLIPYAIALGLWLHSRKLLKQEPLPPVQ